MRRPVSRLPARKNTDVSSSVQLPSGSSFSAAGVDRTLIQWMLEQSPTERLQALQSFVDGVIELRHDLAT